MFRDGARILVVDDEEIVRESLGGWLEKDGYTVATASGGAAALERLRAERWSILIVDLRMPGLDGLQVLEQAKRIAPDLAVVMMTAYATVDSAVAAMKLGAYDYLVKPFDPEELSLLMQRIAAQQSLLRENAALRQALKQEYRFRDLVSKSPAMLAIFELARSAARSSASILIVGERGTGKRVLAQAVHQESPRADGPFVTVACGLPEKLQRPELLGEEEGTKDFARRVGKLEKASGGTLFLDEVGDLSLGLQDDLLRVLEGRRRDPADGPRKAEGDLRVVAATGRDLRLAVEEGRFRGDLLRRLGGVVLAIPPLRQRREDLPLLVEAILERLSAELNRRLEGVSARAMALLLGHGWPSNVRELWSVLERAAVVCTGPIIEVEDLGMKEKAGSGPVPLDSLEDVERRHVAAVLSQTGGNVSQSARILGIDRVTLYNKMRKWGLRRDGEPAPAKEEG